MFSSENNKIMKDIQTYRQTEEIKAEEPLTTTTDELPGVAV